jgi:hypothetical protein
MLKIKGTNEKFWNEKYIDIFNLLGGSKYSEHGEEAVIQAVLQKPKHKFFVDVGAWGERSSNIWRLMEEGWRGVVIDSNRDQAVELVTTVSPKVKTLWQTVTQNNLDSILLQHAVPYDFDFLSVDVDCYEYEIWKNLVVYKPKLVCIEVNQVELDFDVINYDPSFSVAKRDGYGGATIGLMNRLADEKGYDYLCWDVSNVFYIKR